MNIQYFQKNVQLTDQLRGRLETRLQKLEWFLSPSSEVQVGLSFARGMYRAEYTVFNSGMTLRAEVQTGDLTASIDQAADKLERQIDRHRRRLSRAPTAAAADAAEPLEEDDPDGMLVRVKKFTVKPMDAEEAIQQMELLGHTFFVYRDVEAGKICVVYRRRDGHYGLLEPEAG